MAAENRQSRAGLTDRLIATPTDFELFQAIRLTDDHVRRLAQGAQMPAPSELGRTVQGVGEWSKIEFQGAASLGFPAGSVTAAMLARPDSESLADATAPVARLEVTNFGLFGPCGVLPLHYTALIIDRMRLLHDSTLRDFLDVFNQRAIALFYRAWSKHRVAVQEERTALRGITAGWDDSAVRPRSGIVAAMACLVGLGTRGLGDRMAVDDSVVLYHAGHFARFPRSADGLELLLSDAVRRPVAARQFVGRWLQLEPGDQTRLASTALPEGQHAVLGGGAIAGCRVWNVQSVVELEVGPLEWDDFLELLPGSPGLTRLTDLARLYVGPAFDLRVRPRLRASAVPRARLGHRGMPEEKRGTGSRLGWTTFLLSQRSDKDRGDAVFAAAQ